MKRIDVKSLLIGLLLGVILIAVVAATKPSGAVGVACSADGKIVYVFQKGRSWKSSDGGEIGSL